MNNAISRQKRMESVSMFAPFIRGERYRRESVDMQPVAGNDDGRRHWRLCGSTHSSHCGDGVRRRLVAFVDVGEECFRAERVCLVAERSRLIAALSRRTDFFLERRTVVELTDNPLAVAFLRPVHKRDQVSEIRERAAAGDTTTFPGAPV